VYREGQSIDTEVRDGKAGRGETVPEARELLSKESRARADNEMPPIANRCRRGQWLVTCGGGG
jgi:hypothetical protein